MDDSPWMPPQPGQPAAQIDQPVVVEPQPIVSEGRSGRSKWIVGAILVAVVAVGAAGVFAVSSFSSESESGAASPSELGSQLMAAIENEDVLGMIDVLSPGERDLLRQPMIDLVAELTRLEVLTPDASLAAIQGVDIVLEQESVTARATNVPDIVNVDMSAEATSTIDGAAVPIGDLVTDNMEAEMVDEMRGTVETVTEPIDISLTAVEEDGRWYFSLFHTAAESVRADSAPGEDIPMVGIGSDGAESPEQAVEAMFDRIEALDLTGVLRMLNPGEAAALQRYAPLFVDDAQSELDNAPVELSITDRQFRVEGDGDQRVVLIDGLTISGTYEEDGSTTEFTFTLGRDCVSFEIDGEGEEFCIGATASDMVDELLAESPALSEFLDALHRALADLEPIGIELRQFDGRWYVSPVSTQTEAVLAVLRALDRAELDELIELGTAAAEEFYVELFGGLWGYDETEYEFEDTEFEDTEFDDIDWTEETFPPSTVPETTVFEATSEASYAPAVEDACYEEIDVVDAIACFNELVASGEFDVTFMPVALRYPECGFAEVTWSGALWSLPDAEFIAAIEAASPCFLALRDSGQIAEYEVPSEIANLDCFEGRNWYLVLDDPGYDERYWACISATGD